MLPIVRKLDSVVQEAQFLHSFYVSKTSNFKPEVLLRVPFSTTKNSYRNRPSKAQSLCTFGRVYTWTVVEKKSKILPLIIIVIASCFKHTQCLITELHIAELWP